MPKNIESQIEEIPLRPGVYKFFNKNGEILYVGKALSLRSRVRSYFRDEHTDRPHIVPMIPQIENIETIETSNEIEAVVLESALIKQYMPKYNIELKDDKSYAWIYINTKDELPTVKIVRSTKLDEFKRGKLFGPYPDGKAVKQVFRYIRKLHPFCTCNNPKEPCLYYRLGLCNNPKFGEYTVEEYRNGINEIIKFLSGKKKNHIKSLHKEMDNFAKNKEYEKAAILRDKIHDLEHLGEDIMYYKNEKQYMEHQLNVSEMQLEKIQKDLELVNKISRIECYDISNLQGKDAYGSMSVSIDGFLKNSQYRIFKIKTLDTPNDFDMLKEVIQRRLANIGNNSDESLNGKPDLIVLDGGKGQLSKIQEFIPDDIALLAISKGKALKRKGLRKKDQFWYVKFSPEGEKTMTEVRLQTPVIIIRLRDEAHRFAIKHHRNLRSKNEKISVLDKIEGIGDKRRRALIKRFKSVEGIKKASLDEINEVLNNKKLAEAVMMSLNK